MKNMGKKLAAALAVLALGICAPAYGQSTSEGYNEAGPAIENQVDDGSGDNGSGTAGQSAKGSDNGGNGAGSSPSSTDDGGDLPFTGLDVLLIAIGGGLIAGAGIGMRRFTRGPQST